MMAKPARKLEPISDIGMLADRKCGHLIRGRGESWIQHSTCDRRATFILSSVHEGETIQTPLCRTHAKLKCYAPTETESMNPHPFKPLHEPYQPCAMCHQGADHPIHREAQAEAPTSPAKPAFILPTIHSNGTSKDSLLDEACAALRAIEAAQAAIPHPNGRDYYPQGPTVTTKAIDQSNGWRKRLNDLYAELEEYTSKLADL